MRAPRVRFTVRGMLVAVAVVAVVTHLGARIGRPPYYRWRASYHAKRAADADARAFRLWMTCRDRVGPQYPDTPAGALDLRTIRLWQRGHVVVEPMKSIVEGFEESVYHGKLSRQYEALVRK